MSLVSSFKKVWSSLLASGPADPKVVVGVSGGMDSVVLLSLLRQCVPTSHLIVAHFDHQVRPSSTQEAQWVQRLCEEWGVKEFEVAQRGQGKYSENALRIDRLQFLRRVREEKGADFIALGHHAHDQLETVVMRLIRGTGVEGLGGIALRKGVIVRPLLPFSKTELYEYAKDNKLHWLQDETNGDPRFFRNRIRAELIPVFEGLSEAFGGSEKWLKRIGDLTQEIQEQTAQLKKEAKQWISREVVETEFWLSFGREAWMGLNKALQRAIAKKLWQLKMKDTLETKELNGFLAAIQGERSITLSSGAHVTVSLGRVYIEPTEYRERQNKLLKSPEFLFSYLSQTGREQFEVWLKEQEAEVRFLKPGDRFFGKKMKRRCWEQKIPSPERKLLPVVAKKGKQEVIWYYSQPGPHSQLFQLPWILSYISRSQ